MYEFLISHLGAHALVWLPTNIWWTVQIYYVTFAILLLLPHRFVLEPPKSKLFVKLLIHKLTQLLRMVETAALHTVTGSVPFHKIKQEWRSAQMSTQDRLYLSLSQKNILSVKWAPYSFAGRAVQFLKMLLQQKDGKTTLHLQIAQSSTNTKHEQLSVTEPNKTRPCIWRHKFYFSFRWSTTLCIFWCSLDIISLQTTQNHIYYPVDPEPIQTNVE